MKMFSVVSIHSLENRLDIYFDVGFIMTLAQDKLISFQCFFNCPLPFEIILLLIVCDWVAWHEIIALANEIFIAFFLFI